MQLSPLLELDGGRVGPDLILVFGRPLIWLFFLVFSATSTVSDTRETAFWETQTLSSGNSIKLGSRAIVVPKATPKNSGGTPAESPAGF